MRKYNFLYGVIGIVSITLGLGIILWVPKPATLGVIDMRLLISQRAEYVARTSNGGKLTSQQIKDLSQNLRNDLDELAQTNGVILLNKGIVAGGNLPDYTDAALSLLEEGERR